MLKRLSEKLSSIASSLRPGRRLLVEKLARLERLYSGLVSSMEDEIEQKEKEIRDAQMKIESLQRDYDVLYGRHLAAAQRLVADLKRMTCELLAEVELGDKE